MNKEKYLQFIASFLIALVTTIPFYVTGVYAGIDKVTVKGSDGIEGIARATDALDFSVEATSETTNITKDHIYLGSNIKFDKCTTASNKAVACTLKYPATGKQNFGSNPFQFVISLFRDTSKTQLEDSKAGVVIIDSLPPSAHLSIPKKTFSGAENIIVDYEVTDLACNDALCTGICSGIKSIEIQSADNSFKQTIEPKTADCTVKDKITLDVKKFKDGLNKITAKATDKLGQASQEAFIEFSLDSTPPKILTETFIISRRGVAINSYSPFSVPIEVFVDISANDLDANSVSADLTALNPSAIAVKGACQTVNSETHRCKWAINLNPGTVSSITGAATAPSTSKSITINAADVAGNKATVTITKTLALDDKGPVVQSISAGIPKDGKVYAKPNNNEVTVAFVESTGLSTNEVFLHVDGARFTAASCKKEPSWVCKWSNVKFSPGKALLSIKSDTIDILMNPAPESAPLEVIVDDTPPVVTGISLTPVGSLSAIASELFKIEDKIAVEANITEEYDASGTADFSKFIKNAAKVHGTCKRLEDNKQQCTWLSDAITTAGTNKIKFNFSDPAGNDAIAEKSLTVLELDTAPAPDYWKNSVECSPAAIDRQLGTLINQRMYCRVKLEKKVDRVETLFISPVTLSSCKSTQPIIQSVESFNTERRSTEPFLKITLKKDPLEINEAKLTCTFSILSRAGDKITKNPENEVAEIDIKFYNFPLGKFDEGIQKRIDDAKKDARESLKIVGELNKIIFYAKKICQVFGIIYNVVTILSTVEIVTAVALDTCTKTPFAPICTAPLYQAKVHFCGQQISSEVAADSGWKTGGKFCKFVNCQWAPGVIENYQQWITGQINRLPLGKRFPGAGVGSDPDALLRGGSRTGIAGYMDPENNFFTGVLFACVPGIISGLEKQRQIKCLYADCLENSVAKDGMSPTVCEDLKNHAECKYLYGEIFALIPYAAVFDHFTSIIKDALSNPFSAIGIGIGAYCWSVCPDPGPGSSAKYIACEVAKLTSKVGDVIQNVQGIYKEGFKVRQDYCSRLDLEEKSEEEGNQTKS